MRKATDDQVFEAMQRLKSIKLVAEELGITRRAMWTRIASVEKRYGITFERIIGAGAKIADSAKVRAYAAKLHGTAPPPRPTTIGAGDAYTPLPKPEPPLPVQRTAADVDADLRFHLKKSHRTIEDMAVAMRLTPAEIVESFGRLHKAGANVYRLGDVLSLEKTPVPTASGDDLHTFPSDANGYYKFGVISDNHYGSKQCREDVNEDLYDWFAREGCARVYNAGNWIDGEFRFNKFELEPDAHGMHAQVTRWAKRYPKRPGVTTYYIAGDDHEGWYAQREGVDIGRYAEMVAHDEFGRTDLRYLGYMESIVGMRHAGTGAVSRLSIVHPGGGSSYATSYAPQKYVEALSGGEKPAVIVFGHWHKIFDLLIRNVICLGAGCTKDLDMFGRKLKLQYHIGGLIVELWQDERGAIQRWRVEKKQYFDRGYYNNQWSHSGPIERVPA